MGRHIGSQKKKNKTEGIERREGRGGGGWWYILGINSSILPNLLIKNTSPDPLLLPPTDLTLAIKIPIRFRERFRHVRVSALQVIEDLVRGDDVGFATAMCLVQAEQSHNVAVVGVEELSAVFFFFFGLVGICFLLKRLMGGLW